LLLVVSQFRVRISAMRSLRWRLIAALLFLFLTMPAPAPAATPHPDGAHLELVRSRSSRRRTRRRSYRRTPVVSRQQKALAQQMIRNSYEMGKTLPLEQRVALLSRLLYTLPPTVMADEKRQWAEELFKLAQLLPDPESSPEAAAEPGQDAQVQGSVLREGYREQSIAIAAARLSLYDADRALELLDSLPPAGRDAPDARTMAARLVFAIYLERHGGAGAKRLLASARRWGEEGAFPYAASGAVLAVLRDDENAAGEFFLEVLAEFRRRREGWYGVRQFAGLLQRAVALESISEESAEEAGEAVVDRLGQLAWKAGFEEQLAAQAAPPTGTDGVAAAAPLAPTGGDPLLLSEEQRLSAAAALNDVRLSAPQAYEEAKKNWPKLTALQSQPEHSDPVVEWTVDAELQQAFTELAKTPRVRSSQQVLSERIERGLLLVNARYAPGARVEGKDGSGLLPDRQSWALVSLSAYRSPMTIEGQLNVIEQPYWHAYFLAIAAHQVGQPARVADPTTNRVEGEEENAPDDAAGEDAEGDASEEQDSGADVAGAEDDGAAEPDTDAGDAEAAPAAQSAPARAPALKKPAKPAGK
jgi:hypothetical protein